MANMSTTEASVDDNSAISCTANEAASRATTEGVFHLRLREQHRLLDAIDGLRDARLASAHIDAPQIVVCGDQSSGKSSVLQAIARVPFPINYGSTTRFATELILRRSESSHTQVTIEPCADRTANQRAELLAFHHPLHDANHIDAAINAAHQHLKRVTPGESFWKDRLRVEISGPEQPHLTLVDLPGIIHSESGEDARPGDKTKIKDLVESYIQNPRAIVIAVFNAELDGANQEVVDLVIPPDGNATVDAGGGSTRRSVKHRTLGVITKPDRVDGQGRRARIIQIANNEERSLEVGFGWHIVKNLGPDNHDVSLDARNEAERGFFFGDEWSSLNPENVGINKLAEKLENRLMECIIGSLPDLFKEIKDKIREREAVLSDLGEERETMVEKRSYLYSKMQLLQRLIERGLEGEYDKGSFFEDNLKDKRLRDVVRIQSAAFKSRLRSSGRRYNIHEDYIPGSRIRSNDNSDEMTARHHGLRFGSEPSISSGGELETRDIPLQYYCEDLAAYLEYSHGKTPCDRPTWQNVQAIFRQQSALWEPMAKAYGEDCYGLVEKFLRLAVTHVAGGNSNLDEALWHLHVLPRIAERRKEVGKKIQELAWPYKHSYPAWSNEDDRATTQALPADPLEHGSHPDILTNFGQMVQTDWYRNAGTQRSKLRCAAVALDEAETFYDGALDTFVENVPILAIERCLLFDLENLSPSDQAFKMDETEVNQMASESINVQAERRMSKIQIEKLGKFLADWESRSRITSAFTRAGRQDQSTVPLTRPNGVHDRSLQNRQAGPRTPGSSREHRRLPSERELSDSLRSLSLSPSPTPAPRHIVQQDAATTTPPPPMRVPVAGQSLNRHIAAPA